MSDKAEASRTNGRRSRGPVSPRGKARSSQNARKHQLFAKTLNLCGDEEEAAFRECRQGVLDHFQPQDRFELHIAEEIATLIWRKRLAHALLQRQLQQYERPVNAILKKFLHDSPLPELPIPGISGPHSPTEYSPFECNELVLRVVNRSGERSGTERQHSRGGDGTDISADTEMQGNAVEVQAKLGNAIQTGMQYFTTIDRCLDRAIDRLLRGRK